MKKSVLSGVVAIALLFLGFQGFSQCKEWKWPADGTLKAKAEESVSLYTDIIRTVNSIRQSHLLTGYWLTLLI